ncbi:MAG: hypothetical protein GY719_23205 [bacterium]|nr:hypothetical protein [bacterium]
MNPPVEPGRKKGIRRQLTGGDYIPMAQIESDIRLEGMLDPQGELPRLAAVGEGPLVDVFSGGLGIALEVALIVEHEGCGSSDDPEEAADGTDIEALAKVHDGVHWLVRVGGDR